MNNQGLVAAFHRATGQPVLDTPKIPERGRTQLRCRLLREESEEAVQAAFAVYAAEDFEFACLTNVAKELADVLYVVYGWANEYGIDLDSVFAEVHKSNMSKVGAPRRADGKLTKGANYRPPDVAAVLGLIDGRADPIG